MPRPLSKLIIPLFLCCSSTLLAQNGPLSTAACPPNQKNAPGPPPQPRCFATSGAAREAINALPPEARSWLNEDVVYIISPEERCTFLHLQSGTERDQFVEQFWHRRSSNPQLPTNDFKEEHYRRIAFANDNFTSHLIGWKTDRGRTYILLGPPDSIDLYNGGESKPSGTDIYDQPTEVWHYLRLEGLAKLDLEFDYNPAYDDYLFAAPENQWRDLLARFARLQWERIGVSLQFW